MEPEFHAASKVALLKKENETNATRNTIAEDPSSITAGGSRTLKVRLDKWLWAARFFKTRAVARAAVEKGQVFYNGERSKPSREIEIGAMLHIRHGHLEKTVIITGLSTRRRNQEETGQLFKETENVFALEKTPLQSSYLSQAQMKAHRSVRFLRRPLNRNGSRVHHCAIKNHAPKVTY
jgi:ribosome-associated heat shock protein Hsp15